MIGPISTCIRLSFALLFVAGGWVAQKTILGEGAEAWDRMLRGY